jgi:RimJ/RimL family protein N-acetyltransferase
MRIDLQRYIVWDGIPTMADSSLGSLYARMAADGTLDAMNFEGQLADDKAFLAAAKSAAYFALVLADGQPVAVCWLNRFELRRAHLHFCLFRAGWGKPSVTIGKQALAQLISLKDAAGNHCLDVIWGAVPAGNLLASAFVEKCGGRLCGMIPKYFWNAARGRCENALIYSYTREDGQPCEYTPGSVSYTHLTLPTTPYV